jgi:formyltetrahydrofolate synthetase
MAALSLADGLADLRRRLGRIVLALDHRGGEVTAEDLRAAGAMAALLVDAVKPNLMQTLEGSPVLVHTGPFGNVAPGTSSVLADRLGLACADIVVTEAGFGADLGAEKFFDLKCRQAGLRPAAAVLVATARALRQNGASNLRAQVENVLAFGVPVVVAVNEHPGDLPGELAATREAALSAGAVEAVVTRHFAEGGAGALDLARAVRSAVADGAPGFRFLYPDDLPLRAKIEVVARTIYRADGLDLSPEAASGLEALEARGYGRLPVCMAKTPYSLSHDPRLGATPRGFRLPIRGTRLYAGAGYVTALAGDVTLMPGLPERPAAVDVDVTDDGRVTGLR